MFKKKEKQQLSESDKAKLKFYEKIYGLYTYVLFVYIFLFLILTQLILAFIPPDIHWIGCLLTFVCTYILFFAAAWIFSFPIRVLIYRACKKEGLLKQEFLPWVVDWLKVLLLNQVIMAPFLAVLSLVFFYQKDKGIEVFIITSFTLVIVYVVFKSAFNFVVTWFVHGLNILKEGDKYNYWKQLIETKNIKEYPIVIIPIETKANWANAYALGFKNFGVIYSFDVLLTNLSDKQFAAILAHETAHLENNDLFTRLITIILLGTLLLSNLFWPNFGVSDLFTGYYMLIITVLIIIILFIVMIYVTTAVTKNQEYKADIYSRKVLDSGQYLSEALEYLYKVNKLPKETRKRGIFKYFDLHPPLKKRTERLLNPGK